MTRIKRLNDMARDMVGDNGRPNLYFVCVENYGVQLVTSQFDIAYDYWRNLPRNAESSLEDRQTGVIASTEPEQDGSNRLVTYDDSRQFGFTN